jgi:hypothetical protein
MSEKDLLPKICSSSLNESHTTFILDIKTGRYLNKSSV